MTKKLTLTPVKISPIIKGTRWILLIAGIFYGASKHQFLAGREVGIREEEEAQKKIRDDIIKEEKQRQSEIELQMLAELFLGPQATTEAEPTVTTEAEPTAP